MAQIKLSGLVTDIAGSAGGTTFRRKGGKFQLYNKTQGGSYQKQLDNPAIGRLSVFNRFWNRKTPEQRAEWNQAATLYTFPDRFGIPRKISGKQLFFKQNMVFAKNRETVYNPLSMESTVQDGDISVISTAISANNFTIQITLPEIASTWIFIRMVIKNNETQSPSFKKTKIIHSSKILMTLEQINISTDIKLGMPYIAPNMYFRIYMTNVNPDGFVGTTKYQDGITT